jgi:hypothetical protein
MEGTKTMFTRPRVGPLVLSALLFLASLSVQGAIVKVRDVAAGGTGGAVSYTITVGAGGASAGDTLFVEVATAATAGVSTITDARGNSYSSQYGIGTPGLINEGYRALLTTSLVAGDLITITLSASSPSVASAAEFSGLAASPLDQHAGAVGSSTSPLSPLTPMTSQANELLIGSVATVGPNSSFTPDPAYTTLGGSAVGTGGSNFLTIFPFYRVVSAAGFYGAGGTLGGSQLWNATVTTYKDVVAPVTLERFAVD